MSELDGFALWESIAATGCHHLAAQDGPDPDRAARLFPGDQLGPGLADSISKTIEGPFRS